MKVGDFVTNTYHGIVRYGKIVETFSQKDGWNYFRIEWVDDECYTKAISHRKNITDKDHSLKLYRSDKIQKFDLNKTTQTLLKLQNSAE